MTGLPSGTVTLLFTDIEGSTRLLKGLGEQYGEVLDAHRRILRETVATFGGREVDTQGDSFFFVFPRANAAVAASVASQRALAAHEWPADGVVRVRMGLHTGEPAMGDERYVGLGVHRAARVGAVAHGGQVLLSSTTYELVEDTVAGMSIRDLGSYRLKDIDRPERLYQLEVDGLQADFPPVNAPKVVERKPLRRRPIVLSTFAGVLAAAVAIPIFAFGQGGGGGSVAAAAGDSLGIVNSDSGHLVGDVGVGATPTRVAVGFGSYWVANADGHSVSRVSPASRSVIQTIPVGNSPSGITTGNGAVWVANSLDGTVWRIDPSIDQKVQTIPVGNGPVGIVFADGAIWVANTGDETITRIDATTGKPKTLPIGATELAFGDGTLWATESTEGRVLRIDPKTGREAGSINVGNGPTGIAYGNGAAWVANSLDGTVSRIDPGTNTEVQRIHTGQGPTSVAVGNGAVWVTNQFDGTVTRIDPRTNEPRAIVVGNRPQGVAVEGGDVLVSVRESGEGHRGGTLTFRINRSPDSADTAVSYDSVAWTILRMTNDGLVAFNEVGGIQGLQLVPDLAASLPVPTDGGTTYTFHLRPGLRYSTGQAIRASDARATLERDFEVGFPVPYYYDGIVGAAACEQHPRHCDLSRGIVTDDTARTITFHLVAPDPDFLDKLALPFADFVPTGTPSRISARPLPATGPYMMDHYDVNHLVRLVRNLHFREWSKPAQPSGYPDSIVFRIGGTPDEDVQAVIDGKADVFSTSQSQNPPSARLLGSILTRYASQVHENQQPATIAFFLNTAVPPFDNVDARRAVSLAADRAAAVQAVGGPNVAVPTCQILPPYYPGYRPFCQYTASSATPGTWSGPDLKKARALVARSGTRGMKVVFWSWSQLPGLGPYAVRLLRSLGYKASLRTLGDTYFQTVHDSRTKAQIGTNEWISDYPTASGFINALFTCAAFLPRNPGNSNDAEFCDHAVDRRIARALSEQATNPDAARGAWQGIDRQIMSAAPWAPLVNVRVIDVLSTRVGNYQYSAADLGMLIDQLWVK